MKRQWPLTLWLLLSPAMASASMTVEGSPVLIPNTGAGTSPVAPAMIDNGNIYFVNSSANQSARVDRVSLSPFSWGSSSQNFDFQTYGPIYTYFIDPSNGFSFFHITPDDSRICIDI